MAEAPTSSALRKTKSSPPPGEDAEMAVAKKVKFATEEEKKKEEKKEEEPEATATHAGIALYDVGCGVFGGLKRKAFIALLDENPKEFRRRFPDLPARHYDNDDEHPCHGLCCEWEPNDDGLCDSCGFDLEDGGEEEEEGEPDWDAVAEQLGPSWCPDCREGVKLNGACSWCYRVLSRDPATGRLRCEREVLDERDLLDQH